MKTAITGTSFVGISNSVLLAQHHEVVALNIGATKVDLLNNKPLPNKYSDIEN